VPFFNPIGQVHRIEDGPKAGRLIIAGPVKFGRDGPIANPSDIYDYKMQTSALIYSDDDGESWHLAGLTPEGGNEASAVAIDDGRRIIMIRRRNSRETTPARIVNYSDDFGLTWTPNTYVQDMPSPLCLGVLFKDGEKLIFTQPALAQPLPRMPGWIGVSTDEGRTWTGKIIQKGPFSYSDIDRIPGTDIYAVAYSHAMHGELGMYIRFFTEEWLVQNLD
jgi:hypothetical protein